MGARTEHLAGQLLRELLECHRMTARSADLGQSAWHGASGVETRIDYMCVQTSQGCSSAGTLAQLSRRLQWIGTRVRRDHMLLHVQVQLPAWTTTQRQTTRTT
eukprot:4336492-Pyramimonas_sp.AAC.1